MISIIIPTHNRRAFLAEAITAALGQRGVDKEVIVVDDGSTDGTAALLESFGTAVRHVLQPHRGVSAARNRGIRMAGGEWLAFLDSDDLWLEDKLLRQQEFMARHPELRICQTDEVWLRNGQRLNPRRYHRKPRGDCFALLLERCLVSPSAVMLHRELLAEVGLFDETLPACEDYDLWLRIGCRHPLGLLDEALVIKRGGHPDQLSASLPALDQYRIRALTKLLRTEPLSARQRILVLDVLQRKCLVYAQGCRKRGRIAEAEAVLALPAQMAAEPG